VIYTFLSTGELSSKYTFDASALLAELNREPGADRLTPEMLSTATSSTANLAEYKANL
jgi:PIN domain nuclease of toxin-antitoxin system